MYVLAVLAPKRVGGCITYRVEVELEQRLTQCRCQVEMFAAVVRRVRGPQKVDFCVIGHELYTVHKI